MFHFNDKGFQMCTRCSFSSGFSLCAGNKAAFCRLASKLSNGESVTGRAL